MIEKHRKGIESQLIAETHFVKNGYRTFTPSNGTGGPVDFIAINEETMDIKFLEVKTKSVRSDNCAPKGAGKKIHSVLTAKLKELGVQMVYVDLDNGTVEK